MVNLDGELLLCVRFSVLVPVLAMAAAAAETALIFARIPFAYPCPKFIPAVYAALAWDLIPVTPLIATVRPAAPTLPLAPRRAEAICDPLLLIAVTAPFIPVMTAFFTLFMEDFTVFCTALIDVFADEAMPLNAELAPFVMPDQLELDVLEILLVASVIFEDIFFAALAELLAVLSNDFSAFFEYFSILLVAVVAIVPELATMELAMLPELVSTALMAAE